MEVSSVPPGFESLAPFTLKKVEAKETKMNYSTPSILGSDSQKTQMVTESESDDSKSLKSLRRRHFINCGKVDNSSGDESDCEQNLPSKPRLPRGVIRGCNECVNCQKVVARWHPEEACRPDIQDAPVFYPSEEDFEDTLKYISSIRPQAESYGICRIVPPPSWKPLCPLKQKQIWENTKFTTRIQQVDKLQNRDSMRKVLKVNLHKRRKRRRCTKPGVDHGNSNGEIKVSEDVGIYEAERFGFEPGPVFTLQDFRLYADDFKTQYFRKEISILDPGGNTSMKQEQSEPSVEEIEGEYWRMVERPKEEIEVLYGADLETGVFGSGFPKQSHEVGSDSDEKYVNSGWNLNNFPRLPGSVLSYESSDISGVLVPWLYIGMCFSSFCWHVEDHHLYSLNYMHWGAPKMWYGVPGTDALKLESAMRKHLPDLFEEQPDLLHKLVTQLSPSIIKKEGVPVYRCIQNPGEFVLTFPRAYHAGFNCGFNCAEAVNVAPVDWLPHGQNAVELYRDQGRRTSISHDKLLLGAARDAVKANWELTLLRKNTSINLRWRDVCGKEGILYRSLKERVETERVKREFLCNNSQALKMESTFDATSERECSVCLFDLHLSAAGCHYCSPDKYACLNHAKQLCACSWGAKFFLFRYDINELNILVDALEGKLSAVYRWTRLDSGLALSSCISKENSQSSGVVGKPSRPTKRAAPEVILSLPVMTNSNYLKGKGKGNTEILNSTNVVGRGCLTQTEKPTVELVNMEKKACSSLSDSSHKIESTKTSSPIQGKKDLPTGSETRDTLGNLISKLEKKPSLQENNGVILLSDDEGEESSPKPSQSTLKTPKKVEDHLMNNGSCMRDTGSKNLTIVAPVMNTTISSSELAKTKDPANGETILQLNVQGNLLNPSSSHADVDKDVEGLSSQKENNVCNMLIEYNKLLTQPYDVDKSNIGNIPKKLESDVNSRSMDTSQNISCNPSGSQNNLDRYFRQKGPRIAKVVRRINCNVEPLEFGVVHPGKLWCDSHAIYPKDFRSRVKYINVLDPTNMCYYVSEILAGRDGPLFMVSLQESPNEVFCHASATRCWEMVRERVNQEIAKQHKLGKPKLPPLQPPGSLDGMEMFGFSSPAIVQGIQAIDQNRVCSEYWKSRPLMHIPSDCKPGNNFVNSVVKTEQSNDQPMNNSQSLPSEVNRIIDGLFKKANPEELNALSSILNSNNSPADQGLVICLLNEEISRRL